MPELTHDGSEDGFHEIQLSGKQVVFLFMVTTVVSVMIFLCGVLVGRGVRADRGAEADAPIALAATPDAPAATVPTSTAAPVPAAPPADVPPTPEEPTSSEVQQKGAGTAAPKTAEPAVPPSAAAAAAKPVPEPKAPEPAPPSKSEPVGRTASSDVPTSGRPGTWVVQVSALQNREAASRVVRQLVAKGYPAFLLTPPTGTPQIFRVQIGKYSDRREADQVARRLEKEEKFKADIKR